MIYDISPVNNYVGNNSTTTFDFDFYIENENQLNVYLIESDLTKTLLLYNIDYSINEFGNENGSYINYPLENSNHTVLSDTQKISLQLTLPISQETQYQNSSRINLKSVEYSFDYLTRIAQILDRNLKRTVKVEEGDNIDTDALSAGLTTISNNISSINSVFQSISNINQVAQNIQDVVAISRYATYLANVAENALEVTTGATWIQFASSDWTLENGIYKYDIDDIATVNSVFKGGWTEKELVLNVDIEATDDGICLKSLEPFSGYALGSNSIVEDSERALSAVGVLNEVLNEIDSVITIS